MKNLLLLVFVPSLAFAEEKLSPGEVDQLVVLKTQADNAQLRLRNAVLEYRVKYNLVQGDEWDNDGVIHRKKAPEPAKPVAKKDAKK